MSEHAIGCRTANCGGCFIMPEVGSLWRSPRGFLYRIARIGEFRGDGTDIYMRRVSGPRAHVSRRESARYFTNSFYPES
jgi:hypothetical protein